MWPFLLQYGNEDEVELVKEGLLLFQGLFGGRALDDEVDDEIADSWEISAMATSSIGTPIRTLALLSWENLPSCLDNVVKHL